MARCYICDSELTEITFDHDLKIMPCGTCLEAVDEALEDFEDPDDDNARTPTGA
jgi:hypothetical protein